MNFYRSTIVPDPRFKSSQACYDVALLEPNFRKVITDIIADVASRGITLHTGETFRSQARQFYLYSKGLSHLAHVGVHNFGLACDLSLITNGEYDPVGEHYAFLLDLAKAHPCPWGPTVSGIDWGSGTPHQEDWDHLQGVTIAQQARLFAGTWYPTVA